MVIRWHSTPRMHQDASRSATGNDQPFCRECVTAEHSTIASIACQFPNCGKITKRLPQELTVDRRALHLAAEEVAKKGTSAAHGDATGKPAKRRKTSHTCEFNCPEGSEAAATHNCGTCGGMLCSSCHTAHSKMKMFKGHTVLSLGEYLASSASPGDHGGAAPIFTCKKHVGKPLEVFCETCCMLICLKCAVLDHKGNECVIGDLEPMAAASVAELAP
eukprot:gene14696-11793_t